MGRYLQGIRGHVASKKGTVENNTTSRLGKHSELDLAEGLGSPSPNVYEQAGSC